MEKIINNKFLWNHIQSYVPLSDYEKKLKKNIILSLKYRYCEWSSHKNYCYICQFYHPLVSTKYKRRICRKCFGLLQKFYSDYW